MTKPASTSIKALEGQEPSDQAEALGLPLDALVSAVRDAFWDLRTEMRKAQRPVSTPEYAYWDFDDDLCPQCIAVYDGYAVARVGLAHYKVTYTITNEQVILPAQTEWEQVTQEWVTKSIPAFMLQHIAFQRDTAGVKVLNEGRLGNYLVLWGDDKHKDLTGQWFTEKTEGLKAIFDLIGKVPALYQHAMDADVKFTPIGMIDKMESDSIGIWTETQLDLANAYAVEVQKLAKRGALGASSGTLPGARKVAANGEIKQWVIIEGSYTPMPAEHRLRELGVQEVKAIYTELGLELPDAMSATGTGDEESRTEQDIKAEFEMLRLLELSVS